MPSVSWDVFDNLPPSPDSTGSSFDEDEVNSRVRPHWPSYRGILKLRGFRLDTVGDAKAFYRCSADGRIPDYFLLKHSSDVNDALCPDAGLVRVLSQLSRGWLEFNLSVYSPTICFEVHGLATGKKLSLKPSTCGVGSGQLYGFCPHRRYETIQ
jgi:hypothetical protein